MMQWHGAKLTLMIVYISFPRKYVHSERSVTNSEQVNVGIGRDHLDFDYLECYEYEAIADDA